MFAIFIAFSLQLVLRGFQMKYVDASVRLLLALIFAFGGAAKLTSPKSFANLVTNISSLSKTSALAVAYLLSVMEITIGLGLLFKRYSMISLVICSILLLMSTFVGVVFINNPLECGCFGDVIRSKTDSRFLERNLLLLLLAVFAFRRSALSMDLLHKSNSRDEIPQYRS